MAAKVNAHWTVCLNEVSFGEALDNDLKKEAKSGQHEEEEEAECEKEKNRKNKRKQADHPYYWCLQALSKPAKPRGYLRSCYLLRRIKLKRCDGQE